MRWRHCATWLLLACVLAACSQPTATPGQGSPARTSSDRGSSEAGRPKRLTAALRAELPTVSKTLNTIIPGATALDRLVSAGLSAVDDSGTLRPVLAESVPTVENGLWQVFPDGRMETTWKLRPGARWHD